MPVLTRLAPAVLIPALLGSACDIQVGDNGVSVNGTGFRGRASDEWVKTYPISQGGSLEIVNANGLIDAAPAAGRDIEVRVERIATAGTDDEAQQLLGQIQMDAQVAPGRVRLEGKIVPAGGGLRRDRVNLRYHLRIPAGLSVRFETANGGIHLEDVKGAFDTSTTNGGITAVDVSGGVKATSVNGGIRIEMEDVTAPIEVSVTNGGVRLQLPAGPGTRANLEATSVNGGISVDDDLGLVTTERSRTRVMGTLNGGGPRIVASTVNGGITIDSAGRKSD